MIHRNINKTGGRVINARLRQLVADLSELADEIDRDTDCCIDNDELYEELLRAVDGASKIKDRLYRDWQTIMVRYYDSGDEYEEESGHDESTESTERTNGLVDWVN